MTAGLLQINSLGQTEIETAVDTENNVPISVFLTAARHRAGNWMSSFAGAAFGEDGRGLDHHRPAACVQTHQHYPQIPGFGRMSGRTCGGGWFVRITSSRGGRVTAGRA